MCYLSTKSLLLHGCSIFALDSGMNGKRQREPEASEPSSSVSSVFTAQDNENVVTARSKFFSSPVSCASRRE